MANKHSRELRDLETPELEQRLIETQQALTNVRFDLETHQMENTARKKLTKRQIARIKTILGERQLEEA